MYRARLALPSLQLIVLVVLVVALYLDLDQWCSRLSCNDLKLRSVREVIAASHGAISAEPTDHTQTPSKTNCEVCPRAAFFRGRVALEQNRVDQAELLLSERIDESFPFRRLWLGSLYFHQSKISQATEVWSSVPSISAYLTHLGWDFEKSGIGRDRARVLYSLAVQLDPEDQNAHFQLGVLLAKSGEKADLRLAVGHLRLALTGTRRDTSSFYYLGLAHERLNAKVEARRYYMKSLEILPGHWRASFQLGLMLIGEGQPDEAVPVLMRAIAQNPSRPASHYWLGKAFEAMGSVEHAIEAYSQACLLAPNRMAWRRHLEALRSR